MLSAFVPLKSMAGGVIVSLWRGRSRVQELGLLWATPGTRLLLGQLSRRLRVCLQSVLTHSLLSVPLTVARVLVSYILHHCLLCLWRESLIEEEMFQGGSD